MEITTLFTSLFNIRRVKRLTQSRLSELLNLPQSYISQVEQGKHDIRTSTLLNWARVLDMELMLVPRQQVPAVSYLIESAKSDQHELPAAYGPLPEQVD